MYLAEADVDGFNNMFKVNVTGTFLVLSAMSATMKSQEAILIESSSPARKTVHGSIVVLSSASSLSTRGRTFIASPLAPREDDVATLLRRSGEDCRLVHQAQDKCDFVRRNCQDDEAGLLQYLTFYYCHLGSIRPLAFVVLVLWLGLLFTTIGIAASDFFSINLSTIATILGLSESLAGVTFLAFGNGSPDVFSTFAAMGSNSGSMAVGELIGAAGFITSVVAGSMALVREFKVSRKTFVRDICFFIAAVAFAVAFLADGNIHLWECFAMIGFYVFYVIVVVGWHACTKRRKARRAKDAAARSHYFASAGGLGNDELEPYRDDPDDDPSADRHVGARGDPAFVDIGVLERGPRIEVGGPEEEQNDDDDDEDDDAVQHRRRQAAAEMTSNMRLSRPRGSRSNSTIVPIRPSLVGALEFRAVLSSLQEEGNMRLRPIHIRSRSDDGLGRRWGGRDIAATGGAPGTRSMGDVGNVSSTARSRALSSGAVLTAIDTDLSTTGPSGPRGRPLTLHTIDGKLAPPPRDPSASSTEAEGSPIEPSPVVAPQIQRLRRINTNDSESLSPDAVPFPAFTDSPMPVSPDTSQPPSLILPTPSIEPRSPFDDVGRHISPKPVSWWPYQLFPSPYVVLGTLFPTLQSWRSKTLWDKFLSLISVPSIFLLAITLPVVESETNDDDSSDSISELPPPGHLGNVTAPVSTEPNGTIEPETEWQRYRRRTRSTRSGSSPLLIAIDAPEDGRETRPSPGGPPIPSVDIQPPKPTSDMPQAESATTDEGQGWNRWLAFIQIFTGPLFTVFIIWANMAEDLERPVATLAKLLLGSVVGSLVLLGILLLTTSPDRRPKYHVMFCFLGFCISIAWISSVAGEVVGVLKAFGVILNISEAILGLTVFAVGNSIGDLVANITVSRLGYPVMALSACFGGPLLNILLGIGLGGAWQTISAANKRKAKHPDRPFEYRPYHIQVSGTLMVSTMALLVTLLALLIMVPMNKWFMNRRIGFFLIALWMVSTVANLAIEITGVWVDIA
ncbi:hypothetical protein SLS62_005605 [Diatrype stigma]|uniref:Sodium/calcium exchanger membrane region domain-containing protein n=1 Tax=Diatrype stigma TaxID=117547 RepID=A0AAN9USE4_9PEZI